MSEILIYRLYELLVEAQTELQREKLKSARLEEQLVKANEKIQYYEEAIYLKLE